MALGRRAGAVPAGRVGRPVERGVPRARRGRASRAARTTSVASTSSDRARRPRPRSRGSVARACARSRWRSRAAGAGPTSWRRPRGASACGCSTRREEATVWVPAEQSRALDPVEARRGETWEAANLLESRPAERRVRFRKGAPDDATWRPAARCGRPAGRTRRPARAVVVPGQDLLAAARVGAGHDHGDARSGEPGRARPRRGRGDRRPARGGDGSRGAVVGPHGRGRVLRAPSRRSAVPADVVRGRPTRGRAPSPGHPQVPTTRVPDPRRRVGGVAPRAGARRTAGAAVGAATIRRDRRRGGRDAHADRLAAGQRSTSTSSATGAPPGAQSAGTPTPRSASRGRACGPAAWSTACARLGPPDPRVPPRRSVRSSRRWSVAEVQEDTVALWLTSGGGLADPDAVAQAYARAGVSVPLHVFGFGVAEGTVADRALHALAKASGARSGRATRRRRTMDRRKLPSTVPRPGHPGDGPCHDGGAPRAPGRGSRDRAAARGARGRLLLPRKPGAPAHDHEGARSRSWPRRRGCRLAPPAGSRSAWPTAPGRCGSPRGGRTSGG